MSTGYGIIPLCAFSDDASWLVGLGLELPPSWEQSRTPTPEDFRRALSNWEGCDYAASIDGESLVIYATKRDTPDSTQIRIDDAVSNGLKASYGSPEWLVAVTERLAQRCGPFLLIFDASSAIIVEAGTSPEAEWVQFVSRLTIP